MENLVHLKNVKILKKKAKFAILEWKSIIHISLFSLVKFYITHLISHPKISLRSLTLAKFQ